MDETKKLGKIAKDAAERVGLARRARRMTPEAAFQLLCEIAEIDEEEGLVLVAADEFAFVDRLIEAVADICARQSG